MKLTGFYTPLVTDFRATDKEGVGNVRWGVDGYSKKYIWVLNSTGGALTVGGAYTFGTASTGFWTQLYTFGQSGKGTSVNGPVAVAVSAIPSAQYGWVQISGEASAQISAAAGSNVAAFDNLKPVSGQIYLTLDVAAGTAPTAASDARPLALAAGNSSAANVAMYLRGGALH